MQKPKSNTFFHFTDKIEYLKGILENGFEPRFCFEDVKWLDVKEKKLFNR